MAAPDIPPNATQPPDDRATRLTQLIRERDTLRAALPAHSIPPALLIRLEDLDDAIDTLKTEITTRDDGDDTP